VRGAVRSPSRMWRSVRQTPHASTSSSTSPGPGTGSGSSVARSGAPGPSRTMASIRASSTLVDGMGARTDTFDLATLDLSSGEPRRLTLEVPLSPIDLGGERYTPPAQTPVTLDVSRMIGGGYALRLRATVPLSGRCMRCLEPAAPEIEVDAREVDVPGGDEE